MVRIIGNAVGWTANAAKLSSVGLWLNASKSESMLAGLITPLTTVTWVAIVLYQHHPLAALHLKSVCMPKNNFQWWSSQILCRRLNYGTGYCKHESSLCATICWGSASVPLICAGWLLAMASLSIQSPPKVVSNTPRLDAVVGTYFVAQSCHTQTTPPKARGWTLFWLTRPASHSSVGLAWCAELCLPPRNSPVMIPLLGATNKLLDNQPNLFGV